MARPSDDELLNQLRTVAALVEGPLGVIEYNRCRSEGFASAATIARHLGDGSFPEAVRRAGLTPTGTPPARRWTRDEALDALAGWMKRTGSRAIADYTADARTDENLPFPRHLARFGKWRALLAEADERDTLGY